MKEAIGNVPIYSFIIVFIVITFAFLSATIMYYKAFKLNSRVIYALEEFEGYNQLSAKEIDRILSTMGYRAGDKINCKEKEKHGVTLKSSLNGSYPICVYESPITSVVNNGKVNTKYGYFNFGVTTYIYLDIPVVGEVKVPIYTESERLFRFSS